MKALDPTHVQWSHNLFHSLNEGGRWGIPRSGLIFQRHGTCLELVERMPHDPEMVLSKEELHKYQQAEFYIIKHYFEAAGIPVHNTSGDGK